MSLLGNKLPPAAQPVGFLSDVHGHLEALNLVLDELSRLGVAQFVVTGDLLLGGPEPLATWRRLVEVGARCTRGLGDRALVEVDPSNVSLLPGAPAAERERLESFRRTREALGDLVLEQLRRLPETLRLPLIDGGEIVASHGSPADPDVELSHDLDDDEIRARLGSEVADIVVCGATHVPFVRDLGDQRVLNVGSVGAAPTGDVADYAIVRPRMDGPEIVPGFVRL
ncbi:MAG: metallophosphoesterase family protein [Myxococcota bacterium]